MHGKLFAGGLAIGIFMALAVVVGSLAIAPGNNGAVVLNLVPSQQSADAVTTTTTSTVTSIKTYNTSQGAVDVPGSSTTTTTSTSSSGPPPNTPGGSTGTGGNQQGQTDFLAALVNQPRSSQVGSLAQQPLLLNGLVLLPVMVAFVLGAILYGASRRSRSQEE